MILLQRFLEVLSGLCRPLQPLTWSFHSHQILPRIREVRLDPQRAIERGDRLLPPSRLRQRHAEIVVDRIRLASGSYRIASWYSRTAASTCPACRAGDCRDCSGRTRGRAAGAIAVLSVAIASSRRFRRRSASAMLTWGSAASGLSRMVSVNSRRFVEPSRRASAVPRLLCASAKPGFTRMLPCTARSPRRAGRRHQCRPRLSCASA